MAALSITCTLIAHEAQIAGEAVAHAHRNAEKLKEEVRKDLAALDAYEAEHGSFAEMVRQHYQTRSDDGS